MIKLLLSIIWTILIIFGSLTSGDTLNQFKWLQIQHIDKIIHFIWYYVLFFLWYAWLIIYSNSFVLFTKRLLVLLSIIVFGTFLELFQSSFAQNRTFEIADIFINSVGSVFAFITFFPIFHSKLFGRFL